MYFSRSHLQRFVSEPSFTWKQMNACGNDSGRDGCYTLGLKNTDQTQRIQNNCVSCCLNSHAFSAKDTKQNAEGNNWVSLCLWNDLKGKSRRWPLNSPGVTRVNRRPRANESLPRRVTLNQSCLFGSGPYGEEYPRCSSAFIPHRTLIT